MTDDQQERLRAVEATVSEMRVKQTEIERTVRETATLLSKVEANTEEIVSLMKGASVLARLARWIAAIAGAYLAGKGLKWW